MCFYDECQKLNEKPKVAPRTSVQSVGNMNVRNNAMDGNQVGVYLLLTCSKFLLHLLVSKYLVVNQWFVTKLVVFGRPF